MSPTHGDSAEMMLRRRRSEPDDEESKKDQTASSTRASARNQGAEMALVAVDIGKGLESLHQMVLLGKI